MQTNEVPIFVRDNGWLFRDWLMTGICVIATIALDTMLYDHFVSSKTISNVPDMFLCLLFLTSVCYIIVIIRDMFLPTKCIKAQIEKRSASSNMRFGTTYRVNIGGRWFRVNLQVYEQLREGDSVKIEFKPRSNILIRLEKSG